MFMLIKSFMIVKKKKTSASDALAYREICLFLPSESFMLRNISLFLPYFGEMLYIKKKLIVEEIPQAGL